MTIKHLLGGVAAAALLTGASFAQVPAFDAGSDFQGQTIVSEYTGDLAGDLILLLDLNAAGFNTLGAGSVVQAEISLSNATFSAVVPNNAWTDATKAGGECDFGAPTFGGGNGGDVVRFASEGDIHLCLGADSDDGTVELPVEITNVGQAATVTVTFTALNLGGGTYAGADDTLDLVEYDQGLEFEIAAGAPGEGLFDAAGDALLGGGVIGTISGTNNGGDIDLAGTPLADADDIAASGTLTVTFPSGAEGIGSVNAGFGACSQGVAPNDNVFTCALTGANLNTIVAADQDITITDDGDPLTFITAQTPSAELSIVSVADFDVAGAAGNLQVIELDDGLNVGSIGNSNFAWTRFGSGGTESNFRIQFADEDEANAVTEVRVEVDAGNGVDAQTVTLVAGTANDGFVVQGATVTFNSRALGATSGQSGNADITGVDLQFEDSEPNTANNAVILRQLINRNTASFVATPGLESDN